MSAYDPKRTSVVFPVSARHMLWNKLPKLWLEKTRPSRSSRFKQQSKLQSLSAGIVALGLAGTGATTSRSLANHQLRRSPGGFFLESSREMTLIPDAGPCPRCGGKLEIKTTVEKSTSGPPVHFFRCKDCGQVHTVERRSS